MSQSETVQTIILSFSIAENSVCDYFLKLSNRLAHSYRVVIVTDRVSSHPFYINPEIIILRWPSARPTTYKDFIFLKSVLETYKPQLTISLFGSVNLFLLAGFLKRVPQRIAWIRTLTTQFPQKKFNIWRKRVIYILANQVICNSEATKIDASYNFGIPKSKLFVLPNSVEDYINKIDVIPNDENLVVYVGRLHPSKGVDVLIRAFAIVSGRHPNKKLLIIGNGPIIVELQQLVVDLNLDNVKFAGALTKDNVLENLQKSYCSVVPSHTEAFGYTVIESMSMQTCVIGANNTGIKEIIEHELSGLLFKTGDEKDLAEKIQSVCENKAYRDKLAKRGYERFKKFYSIDIALERDYRHFKNLI